MECVLCVFYETYIIVCTTVETKFELLSNIKKYSFYYTSAVAFEQKTFPLEHFVVLYSLETIRRMWEQDSEEISVKNCLDVKETEFHTRKKRKIIRIYI
jgi:hypothetical protein